MLGRNDLGRPFKKERKTRDVLRTLNNECGGHGRVNHCCYGPPLVEVSHFTRGGRFERILISSRKGFAWKNQEKGRPIGSESRLVATASLQKMGETKSRINLGDYPYTKKKKEKG